MIIKVLHADQEKKYQIFIRALNSSKQQTMAKVGHPVSLEKEVNSFPEKKKRHNEALVCIEVLNIIENQIFFGIFSCRWVQHTTLLGNKRTKAKFVFTHFSTSNFNIRFLYLASI